MDLNSLDDVGGDDYIDRKLDDLPREVQITDYAMEKAEKVNEAVKEVTGKHVEWYGFTIAHEDNPEMIVDIGLGDNDTNRRSYTNIEPENIEEYRQEMPDNAVINGWIHSHADLGMRNFSGTDAQNHKTVLNYVSTVLNEPIAKQEVAVDDMELLVEGAYDDYELEDGTVTVITDEPVDNAQIIETVLGTFSYAMLVGNEQKNTGLLGNRNRNRGPKGNQNAPQQQEQQEEQEEPQDDSGGFFSIGKKDEEDIDLDVWKEAEIHYLKEPMLSGEGRHTKLPTDRTEFNVIETDREFDEDDYEELKDEVEEKIDNPGLLGGLFSGGTNKKGRGRRQQGGQNRYTSGSKHGNKTHTPNRQGSNTGRKNQEYRNQQDDIDRTDDQPGTSQGQDDR
jgi:hypothetical protein